MNATPTGNLDNTESVPRVEDVSPWPGKGYDHAALERALPHFMPLEYARAKYLPIRPDLFYAAIDDGTIQSVLDPTDNTRKVHLVELSIFCRHLRALLPGTIEAPDDKAHRERSRSELRREAADIWTRYYSWFFLSGWVHNLKYDHPNIVDHHSYASCLLAFYPREEEPNR